MKIGIMPCSEAKTFLIQTKEICHMLLYLVLLYLVLMTDMFMFYDIDFKMHVYKSVVIIVEKKKLV